MIFIMSAKQWSKSKKKLVIPKDYIIVDATDDDDARMNAFTNVITLDAMNPPSKLVKLASDEKDTSDIIDYDKIEKLEKEFFKGRRLREAIMATIACVVENHNINIFIVMRNKAFKCYKNKMKKAFQKVIPVDFDFVEVYSGDVSEHKKSLKYTMDEEEIHELKRILKKREKESEENYKKKKKKK